ncbi:porin [Chitinibacter sp. SCUT-21]|uniref:porin n=1 Tax=Chitinibacter sp. SCUT-21 TaxID=2970891 RepID=UPI0035A6C89D
MRMKPMIGFLAAALVAGAAHAEVSVSGAIGFESGYNTNSDTGVVYLLDNGSHISFKGKDKLDGGATLSWEVSSWLGVSDDGSFGSRKAYIRYGTELGSFTFGRDDSVMRMATSKYDIFEGYTSLGNILERGATSRPTNQIKYVSPRMGGLAVAAATIINSSKNGEPKEGYAAGVDYKFNDALNFDVAYSVDVNLQAKDAFVGKKRETIAAGVNGEFADGFSYGLRYSDYSNRATYSAADVDSWAAGATLAYASGKNAFRVGYTYASGDSSKDGVEGQLAIVGYTYNLSKQSYIYTELSSFINGDNRQSFGEAGPSKEPALGDSSTTLAVGMVTSF